MVIDMCVVEVPYLFLQVASWEQPWFPWTWLSALVLSSAYFVALHAAFGQTLGKKVTGIKVISFDGTACGVKDAFRRALVFPIGFFVPVFGPVLIFANILSPLFNWDGRSLGDRLGDTRVVRNRPA